MRVIVTGGTGFVGRHLLNSLRTLGFEGIVVGRRRPPESLPPLFSWKSLDLTSGVPGRDLFRGVKGVFHLAGVTRSWNRADFMRGNYIATRNLVEGIKRAGEEMDFFVFLSSQSAAGPSSRERPRREEDPPEPISFYGYSKFLAEGALRTLGDLVPWVILRPAAVYGPGDRDFLWVFRMIKLRLGLRMKGVISLIYVGDLIKGILRALECQRAFHQVFFLADPEVYEIQRVVEEAGKALGRWPPLLRVPAGMLKSATRLKGFLYRMDAPITEDKLRELFRKNWACSTEKAQNILGFTATTPLPTGLIKTISWYRERGML